MSCLATARQARDDPPKNNREGRHEQRCIVDTPGMRKYQAPENFKHKYCMIAFCFQTSLLHDLPHHVDRSPSSICFFK